MKCKSPRFWKAVIFCCLFLLLFVAANRIFQPVWYEWNNYYTFRGFYKEPEDSIETVFLGSSVVASGISPMQLYEEYGICSYNLGGEAQPLLVSYYWLQEAHRLHSQTLKNVALDASMLRRVPEDIFYRKSLDPMAFSSVKLQALWAYTGNNVKETLACLLPFVSYHSRWDELTSNNFSSGRVDSNNGARGQHLMQGHYASLDTKEIGLLGMPPTADDSDEFHEESLFYLEKIVDFCRENELDLVLFKTPTDGWSSQSHQAAVRLAQIYSLPFLDFNYAPLYDDLSYCYPFDNYDSNHLNIVGAQKFTAALGRQLVQLCSFTDIRGSELATHLEEQRQLYHTRASMAMVLNAAQDITSYLSAAIAGDNTILLSIRDEGTWALTTEQRRTLDELGLETLSALAYQNSYLAMIGEDGITEQEKAAEEVDNLPLSFSTSLSGHVCTIKSGGFSHGSRASIVIDGTEYAQNQPGINVVVYSNPLQEVIHTAVFDTCAESSRDVYSPDMGPRAIASTSLCVCENPLDYLEAAMASDNIVLIAVRDEGSAALTEDQRRRSEALGLPQLSELSYRDSYLAVLDGDFRMELSGGKSSYTYSFEDDQFSLESAGMEHGNMASLCVNGVDYAKNQRGLNILVYSKELNAVIDSAVFDTCASPLRKPFTLETLSIYELKDCSIYEQAQLYETARYMEKQRWEGDAA